MSKLNNYFIKMKKQFLLLSLVLVAAMVNAAIPAGYYSDAEGKTGKELKASLHRIISDHKVLSYDDVWSALMYTDEDPDNSNNVILLYSGWSYPKSNKGGNTTQWNREHTWAKSQGDFGTSNGPGTDIHHLRPTDVTVNSARGSLRFDEGGTIYTDQSRYGGGNGTTACRRTSDTWEPADEVKGDVARMLFYMATRYEPGDKVDLELAENNSSSGKHGRLSTLLKWHVEDPVSDWERRRNDRIQEKQGNRNPFIDHPEYVSVIWNDDYESPDPDSTPDPDGIVGFDLNFDAGLDGCKVFQISGETGWAHDKYESKGYAKVNTYGEGANESWLVTPAVNLDEMESEVFSFAVASYNANKTIGACGAGQFEVYYSTTFDGSTINKADWTRFEDVDDVQLGAKWDFVDETIDVSAIKGTKVYFAFAHKSSSSNGTTWEVDNVKLAGEAVVDPDPTPDPDGTVGFDFNLDAGLGGCEVFQLSGETGWAHDTYGTKGYAKVNTYGKGANESWLVTPAVNLDEMENEVFSFAVASYNANKTIGACGAGQFEVYYSTTFDGSTINKADWTRFEDVDDVQLGEKWDFVDETIDVSAIVGTKVYFAFAHKSSSSNGTTWEVDNVKLTGEAASSLPGVETSRVVFYPNPCRDEITLEMSAERVEIISVSGAMLKQAVNVEQGQSVNIADLNAGVYLVKVVIAGESHVQRLVKQ